MDYKQMSEVDIKLNLLSGKSFFLDNLEFIPLTLNEVVEYGYENYLLTLQSLFIEKYVFTESMDEAKVSIIEEQAGAVGKNTVFDYYIKYADKQFLELLGASLAFIFRTDDIMLKGDTILIDSLQREEDSEPLKIVSRDNFKFVIEIIKLQNNIPFEKEEDVKKPKDERARKLIEKMEQNKRALEAKKQAKSEGNEFPFNDIISAITTRSNSINKFNIWSLTIYQIYDEFERINAIEGYQVSIESMMHGAKVDDLQHWAGRLS